jgi:hypothetical protein
MVMSLVRKSELVAEDARAERGGKIQLKISKNQGMSIGP